MQNIPMFTTENGIASLTLQEIPYTQKAYIRIQNSAAPELLLKDCLAFCRSVGASQVYATGHPVLAQYSNWVAVLQMQRPKEGIPETDACVFPVQKKTLERWRAIYNEKMRSISNCAYMTLFQAEKLLEKGNAYFVQRGDELLGIGVVSGNTVESVVSAIPGAGKDVLTALISVLIEEEILLEVASDNLRAISLYRKMGFVETKEISRWYEIFNNVK